jgi:hypothetical protein
VAASLDRQLHHYGNEEEEDEEYEPAYHHQQQQQQQQRLQGMQHLQQQQQLAPDPPTAQQRQQPHQKQDLAAVLSGPMDVSQLWEAAPAASLEHSYEQLPYQQHASHEQDDMYSYDDEDLQQENASRDSSPYLMFGEWTHACVTCLHKVPTWQNM